MNRVKLEVVGDLREDMGDNDFTGEVDPGPFRLPFSDKDVGSGPRVH